MSNNKIHSDLVAERKKCTFNTLELTHLLDGGVKKTNERKERGKYFIIYYFMEYQ